MEKKREGNKVVEVIDTTTGYISNYSMSLRLKRNLDDKIIPSLHKKDKDYVLCIDGKEGAGKSTFAMQIGKYVDPSLNLNRIVFSPEDFREAILSAKKGQCVIYDEAFTGFSSRSSLSPVNKVLVSLMMQIRQKNLFILIVLPTIFMLEKYIALYRTKFLIHVFESKGTRGYFKVYNSNKKKLLILFGKKTLSYSPKIVRTNFKGRFYGVFALGDEKVEAKYKKKKEQALRNSERTSMTSAQVKFKEQRDLIIWLFRKHTRLKYREIENLLLDYELEMSFQQIQKICAKFGDKSIEEEEKRERIDKKKEIISKNKEKEVKSDENGDFDEEIKESEG